MLWKQVVCANTVYFLCYILFFFLLVDNVLLIFKGLAGFSIYSEQEKVYKTKEVEEKESKDGTINFLLCAVCFLPYLDKLFLFFIFQFKSDLSIRHFFIIVPQIVTVRLFCVLLACGHVVRCGHSEKCSQSYVCITRQLVKWNKLLWFFLSEKGFFFWSKTNVHKWKDVCLILNEILQNWNKKL